MRELNLSLEVEASRSQRVTGSLPQMTLKQLLLTFYGIYLILQPLRLLL